VRTVIARWTTSIVLSMCSVSLLAQRDLPQTIGSASQDSSRGPYMFCALPDASAIPAAFAAAVKGGRRPFVVGWELNVEPPPRLAKILLVTSLPRTGVLASTNCMRVQRLPAGGVDAMELHTPYALVDKAIDWAGGYTQQVMTMKNDALEASQYVPRLKRHVKLVTELFESQGLDGYIVYAGDNFEWAYLHWMDRETSQKAFATPLGRTGPQDSQSFQHALGASTQIFPNQLPTSPR
jgi:hypothetical protein